MACSGTQQGGQSDRKGVRQSGRKWARKAPGPSGLCRPCFGLGSGSEQDWTSLESPKQGLTRPELDLRRFICLHMNMDYHGLGIEADKSGRCLL